MSIKWIGAILIIAACGGFGFALAAAHRREERTLRELLGILDFMESELTYRLTALPDLFKAVSDQCTGDLKRVFCNFTKELNGQILPEVSSCMSAAVKAVPSIPSLTAAALENLGRNLGRFELEGQLKGLTSVKQRCRRDLERLERGRDQRLRSYQTLGLCAGAALAILFL